MPGLGGNFCKGIQDEPPLMHTRVRDDELRLRDDDVPEEQDIEINLPRLPFLIKKKIK